VVAQQHRLRLLHMGVARHDDAEVVLRQPKEGGPQRVGGAEQAQGGVLRIHPLVERHLVVSRPRGMQPLPCIADKRRQRPLDRHVDVLVGGIELEGPRGHLAADRRETSGDGRGVLGGDDAARGKHVRVRQRAADVGVPHALIERERSAELDHELVQRLGEPATPWRLSVGLSHASDLPVLADLAPLARPDLRGQTPQLDEALGGSVVERVGRVVGRKVVIVE
jgi:hypothetical protein